MARSDRDAAFTTFVGDQRDGLVGTSHLIWGDTVPADDLVQSVLARLYDEWARVPDPRTEAYRRIVHAGPGSVDLPWQSDRVQLVDKNPAPAAPRGIVGDLTRLTPDQRRVVVLERYAELPAVQIAAVTGHDVARVGQLGREAAALLTTMESTRSDDQSLAGELRTAVAPLAFVGGTAAGDLEHGRLLQRRRRTRVGLLAASVVVLLAIAVSQVLPVLRGPAPQAAPAPIPSVSLTPTYTLHPPPCDIEESGCRGVIARDWRQEMAAVTSTYVDPKKTYYSGYSYAYDDSYDTEGFWNGSGGALGLDMFRIDAGGTEVFIQIATSRQFAIPCGQMTKQTCESMRFMVGNRFTLTPTTNVSEGIEIQYSPAGDQVITVVARNRTGGKTLPITRGDLLNLVQDERLRLPLV